MYQCISHKWGLDQTISHPQVLLLKWCSSIDWILRLPNRTEFGHKGMRCSPRQRKEYFGRPWLTSKWKGTFWQIQSNITNCKCSIKFFLQRDENYVWSRKNLRVFNLLYHKNTSRVFIFTSFNIWVELKPVGTRSTFESCN